LLADASKTGLPDESVDVAFLFGVVHALKDLEAVVEEMHRVLKIQGILSVQSSRLSKERLVEAMTRKGLFRPLENEGQVYRFSKGVLPSEGGDRGNEK
jgi:ubiquinone/menaquinone biosynthesis C-methylase UbiE